MSVSNREVIMQGDVCGICLKSDKPATILCVQCLVSYHPSCVSLSDNLKITRYVCITCRSSMHQRKRRTQASHTIVVGASEAKRYVKPSCNSKPKTKNTVVCQGKVVETAMTEGTFYEQYVYEMKQTRGPSLMTCVVQEPKNLDKNAEISQTFKKNFSSLTIMQNFVCFHKGMIHIFSYLDLHDLLSASRVSSDWKMVADSEPLWQKVYLKNSMICDWKKCVDTIIKRNTVSLDTRGMLIPMDNLEEFWLSFCKELKRANKIKTIELYRCPTHVVEDLIYSLPQLKVLNANSIKDPLTKDDENTINFMTLSLKYLSSAENLTEIRLKNLSGMKLSKLPTFKHLTHLRTLSLTSIKCFPKDICFALDSVTTNLEHLAIGDCNYLFEHFASDFAVSLERLFNLKSLRLENCSGDKWNVIAQDIFRVIRHLDKLTILELINIEFNKTVEEELGKCCAICALLIIPKYSTDSASTIRHLTDCLEKLSTTLTHLVWGFTLELLHVTDRFVSEYKQFIDNYTELPDPIEISNNIAIQKLTTPKQQSEEYCTSKNYKINILSVPDFGKSLESMMTCAKTRVIKVALRKTTRVYISDYFNDI